MDEEEIGELLQALCEDFTAKELLNRRKVLKDFRELLGYKGPVLHEIFAGVRELKKLRGDVKPRWTGYLLVH